MYKLLLCWRYLRTRYIALASVISVTLGVATMIVVNSVMAGFSHEMMARMKGVISDVVFESHSLAGFQDADWHMREIRRLAGDDIAGMTPTVAIPAMLNFQVRGQWITRQVNFIGVDEKTCASASDFSGFLLHPANRQQANFELRDGGYGDSRPSTLDKQAPRKALIKAGWPYRREKAKYEQSLRVQRNAGRQAQSGASADPFARSAKSSESKDPFAIKAESAEQVFDPATEQHTGVIMGIALASYRDREGTDRFLVLPGDDVRLTFPTAATPPKAVSDVFTITDFYESKMSEYDSSFVFVPLRRLQELRGMIDPTTGVGSVTSLQIKLKEGVDASTFRDKLKAHFPPELYGVYTWQDKQGPLLAAVRMETAILNVLLFLIIAVAGFGILAIFFMIVVEKTRDIGILKSLGASRRGVLGIFLSYGLSLGVVGSGVGLVLGVLFVFYINEIADLLGRITGQPVFDPSVYYFQKIPTIIEPFTLVWIVAGAMMIAVMASILPARRAACLHPVEALRYE